MYTIAEFRKNMRQAFEDSNQGHEVVVERYGQKFQLVSLVDKPMSGHSFESTPKAEPKIIDKPMKEVIENIKVNSDKTISIKDPTKSSFDKIVPEFKLCKHFANPTMCKFAKPGKPCK